MFDLSEYMDFLSNLGKYMRDYIPPQLLRDVDKNSFGFNSGEMMLQTYIDKANNRLRMYGTGADLEVQIRTYVDFPLSFRKFNIDVNSLKKIDPTRYYSLKDELFYCKQELLIHLQDSVHKKFRILGEEIPDLLLEYMKKHREMIDGCYEFVKYDAEIFDEIQNLFEYSNNLEDDRIYHEDLEDISMVPFYECRVLETESDDNSISFDKLIDKYPHVLLKNSDPRVKNKTLVVRIFEDGDRKFVMESEFCHAYNTVNPNLEPLKCRDTKEKMFTITGKEIHLKYKNEMKGIEFIRTPILRAKHAATPVISPSGDYCILASDALFDILRRMIHVFNLFQKHDFDELIDVRFSTQQLSVFTDFIDEIYFVFLSEVENMRKLSDMYWESYLSDPETVIKDVGPNGFTLEEFKNEFEYLGLMKCFPDILNYAEKVFETIDKAKKGPVLRTCDKFDAFETCQIICFLNKYPAIKQIVHFQRSCGRVAHLDCEFCAEEASTGIVSKNLEEREKEASAGSTIQNESNSMPEESTLSLEKKVEKEPESAKQEVLEENETVHPCIEEVQIAHENSEIDIIAPIDAPIDIVAPEKSILETTSLATSEATPAKTSPSNSPSSPGTDPIHCQNGIENSVEETTNTLSNSDSSDETAPIPGLQEHYNTAQRDPIHSQNCIESFESLQESLQESRKDVIKAYKKIMVLEMTLKEKNSQIMELEIFEEKARKSEELEEKLKEMEKEAKGLKLKHLKLLEENVQKTSILKKMETGHFKRANELDKILKEKNEQLESALLSNQKKDRLNEELNYEMKEMANEISRMNLLNDQFKRLLRDKEDAFSELELKYLKLQKMEQKNKQLAKEKSEIEKKMKELEEKNLEMLEKSDKKYDDLKEVLKNVENNYTQSAKEIEELKKTHSELFKKKNEEILMLKQTNLSLIKLKDEELETLKRSQEERMKEKKKEIERLKQIQKSNQQQISELKTAIQQLQNKFFLISLENQQKSKVIQDIQTSISSLTSSNNPPTDLECLICFSEMKSNEKTLKCEQCQKVTHLECASKWLKIHRSCPHCRREQLDPNEFPNLQ